MSIPDKVVFAALKEQWKRETRHLSSTTATDGTGDRAAPTTRGGQTVL